MRVSIVGWGYVGQGQQRLLERRGDVQFVVYDPPRGYPYDGREQLMRDSDLIIVCVPTPSGPDGEIDLTIVTDAVWEVVDITRRVGVPILIRSTVTPGTTDSLARMTDYHGWINFSPEFIVERTGEEPRDRMIVGGPLSEKILGIYEPCLEKGAELWSVSPIEAEMVKYKTNAFLAMRVAFAVEMARVCEALGLDPDAITDVWQTDPRVGTSHNRVIADEQGRVGFGGKCLPKDTAALEFQAGVLGVETPLLSAVMQYAIRDQ